MSAAERWIGDAGDIEVCVSRATKHQIVIEMGPRVWLLTPDLARAVASGIVAVLK